MPRLPIKWPNTNIHSTAKGVTSHHGQLKVKGAWEEPQIGVEAHQEKEASEVHQQNLGANTTE